MLTHLNFPNFENDMLKKKGMNLQTRINDDDDPGSKVNRFTDRVILLVETEVRTYNKRFDYERASEPQKEAFYEATLEQALYLYVVGDMNLINGYDPINNSVVSIDEIRKRAMSPIAKRILLDVGLLYRGITNSFNDQRVPGYREFR